MFAHVMYNRQDVYQKRERDRDNKNKKREGERATSKGIFVEVFSQSTWCRPPHPWSIYRLLPSNLVCSSVYHHLSFPKHRPAAIEQRCAQLESMSRRKSPGWSTCAAECFPLLTTHRCALQTIQVSEAPRILPVLSPWIACQTAHNTKTEEILI